LLLHMQTVHTIFLIAAVLRISLQVAFDHPAT